MFEFFELMQLAFIYLFFFGGGGVVAEGCFVLREKERGEKRRGGQA